MKKTLVFSVVAAALFMAGCSSKAPVVNDETNVNNDSTEVVEVVDIVEVVGQKVQNVYFDFDKFNIKASQQGVLNANAELFKQDTAKDLNIVVEGNCDEWGSDEYNYALGLKRAKAAKDALVSQGVDASRIKTLSNGESKPVCTERSKKCDALNRRDEFKVIK